MAIHLACDNFHPLISVKKMPQNKPILKLTITINYQSLNNIRNRKFPENLKKKIEHRCSVLRIKIKKEQKKKNREENRQ